MAFWPRAVLHVDMDAFFASVEQLDDPRLRGRPVVVGGPAETRGVVAAASYEARKYGIHSAMAMSKALRLCPHAVRVSPRGDRYAEISDLVHAVFERYSPAVQPVSIDEAFLDVTGCQRLFGEPAEIASAIKTDIRRETGLTASVGVAPCRFVAKIASDLEKPDGLVVIPEAEVLSRLAPLAVGKMWGVGRVTAEKLRKLGVETIGELRQWPAETLREHFGSAGDSLHSLARGLDPTPVCDGGSEKSISNENTFARDVTSLPELECELLRLADKVAERARRRGYRGGVAHLKVRYEDFSTVTRQARLPSPTCTGDEIYRAARTLLRQKTEAGARPVRLIGVGISALSSAADRQASLFEPGGGRREELDRAADAVRDKFGDDLIGRASTLRRRAKPKPPRQSRPGNGGSKPC